ncbi:rootletin [Echeneis naucrates]|uniref:Rootletin-like n=1 Tax=Echeneis naucrates TaxID=173247 RepID=A0A665W3N8_ECHNA|nr:rootletin-like [Echeneis naucrates]
MASCLVPDFPAVLLAVEHLKELDRELREQRAPFAPEASLHLTDITAAITELESERRAAHERLEVETIENSKLRHRINKLREQMSQEIMADVAAARASNAKEMEQLQKDLNAVCQLHEATVKRLGDLLAQNKALYPQRDQVKSEHEEIIAALNDQITLKYSLQKELDQTQEQIEELKSCIAAVEQDKITLEQSMVLERQATTVKNDDLSRDVDEMDETIKQQKQAIRRSRGVLKSVINKKQETHGRVEKLMADMAKLESSLQRLTASRCQLENQLQGETQKHHEMRVQRDALRKELCDQGQAFSAAIQHLKGEIATVEEKIKKTQASSILCRDLLAQVYEIFKQHHDEEKEVRAEHLHVLLHLERSKLQLEERIASIVKHRKEIKEMDKQTRELLEADTINQRVFQRNQEELCANMQAEKKNISCLEEEKSRLKRLLEDEKRKQEEHMEKMNSEISKTRRRYEELLQEQAALHQCHPKSIDPDLLMSHFTECEVEYREIESKYYQEIQQCIADAESLTTTNEEKQREVEEQEVVLREVEARWNEEQSRHQKMEILTSELKWKKTELEQSIQGAREKTSSLLQPREELKVELEKARANHMEVHKKLASELRAVEISIYNNSVKLEQVSMENSRIHLCITQMTEDVSRAQSDRDRYSQETQQFKLDRNILFDSLQKAWREDLLVTEDGQNRGTVMLKSMSDLLNRFKSRKLQLENVNVLLHQQMLDFSKRLGDKAIVAQQSKADKRDSGSDCKVHFKKS